MKKVSEKLFRYVFEFVIAGFAGWLYEVGTMYVLYRGFYNRGMLHLPVIPIYPVGAFILLAILREKKHSPLFLFLFSTVVTTVFELAASYLLEFIFHEQFWSYEGWYLSILDRSCVISSAIFGVLALLYFYWLHPLSGKISEKLPKPVCLITSMIIISVLLTDFAVSAAELLK